MLCRPCVLRPVRSKYLIPMDMTVGQLVYVLRKRISLPAEKAIFVFVNNTCGPPTASHLIRLPARARQASLPPTPRTVGGVSPRCLG